MIFSYFFLKKVKNKILTFVGGDAYSAPIVHIKETGANAKDDFYYLHRDYLGSILAITDSNANIVEQRQFGAWGVTDKFLNSAGDTEFNNETSLLNRGYTGHEHFFGVSLIHMNGRMYDAKLGRFLSPDNFVQDPYNTQNFNRYGYVLNNPLMYSDESGECVLLAIGIGILVGAGIDYGIQVASNYALGFRGKDAWVNKVDFFDVAVSGVISGLTAGLGTAVNMGKSIGKFGMFVMKNPNLITSFGIGLTSAVDITGEGVQPVTFKQFGQRVVTGIAVQHATKAISKAIKGKNHPDIEVDGQKYRIKPANDPSLADVKPMKSTMKLGRDIHDQYKLDDIDVSLRRYKEYRQFKGMRPDFIDLNNKTIFELKPFNPAQIKLGNKQLLRYQNLLGMGWKVHLDVYYKYY